MDYLAAEILKLASNAARDINEKRVIPHNLQHAIGNDDMSIMRGILSSSTEDNIKNNLVIYRAKRPSWHKAAELRAKRPTPS